MSKIYCLTGFDHDKRELLTTEITKLGHKVSGSLTNHVTHLICDKATGDKYVAARKLNIKIVTSNFILNQDQSEIHYCGELQGLIVTTTGYADMELEDIKQLITDYNGIYEAEMTIKTDLVLRKPGTNSAKTKAAEKWKIRMEPKSFLSSLRDDFKSDMFENKVICLGSKFDEALENYLRKIVRFGGGNMLKEPNSMVTHFVLNTNKLDTEMLAETLKVPAANVVTYQWLCDSFMKNQIQLESDYQIDKQETTAEKRKVVNTNDQQSKKPRQDLERRNDVFNGIKFCISGFNVQDTNELINNIVMYGGKIDKDDHDAITISPFKLIQTKENSRTEFWVEQCLQENKLINPDESILYLPTKISLPIPEFKGKVIGITGFETEDEQLWIAGMISNLG